MSFLTENIGTILIGAAVAAVVAAVVFKLIKDKKNGHSSCGCGCAGCPSADICHRK